MLAFTFPGQGSQRAGMGAAWTDHPSWELVAEASAVTGRDIAALLLDADAEELRATSNAQLATFVMSLVVLDAVERVGLVPALVAGHSLGEYTALAATGSLSLADGLRVVDARGNAMQRASEDNPGTMAAVLGLSDDDVDAACRRSDGEVWVANFNAPGQVVIGGDTEAVAAAGRLAKELGATKVLPIPVGGAFHTPYMTPARDELRKALAAATLRATDVPVVANVDARPHAAADDWTSLLSAQLCSPVRWRQTVERLIQHGVHTLIEIGPGNVLTSLVKRISREVRGVSVSTPDDLDHLLELLSGEPGHDRRSPDGEHLYMTERMVVSPTAGVFVPAAPWAERPEASPIDAGDLIGVVSGTEVRSRFAGTLMGLIAVSGERVTTSQPIAWLRTAP